MALSDTVKRLNLLKEQNLRLSIPRRTLFAFLLGMLAVLFVLVSLSSYYMVIVTVPLLGYWVYAYYWFSGVWRSFGYSAAVLIAVAVVITAAGILVGRPTGQALWLLIRSRFG